LNSTSEKLNFNDFVTKNYKDLISSAFAETDLGFSNQLSAKIGVRAEHSSYLGKAILRLALAYRLAKDWTTSFAYGIFYQNPESRYINGPANLDFQKSQHYIFQVQRTTEGRSLRFEAFYKKYDDLLKVKNLQYIDGQNQFVQTADNNSGFGYAKGWSYSGETKKHSTILITGSAIHF
jgi:outer membrane cobalamin receptor